MAVDLRGFFGLIHRELRLIFVTVIALLGLTATVLYSLTPLYEATALVLVDPRRADLLDPNSQVSLLPGDSARVESEVEILRSRATLLRVFDAETLVSDPEFADGTGWRSRIAALLRGGDTPEGARERALDRFGDRVTATRRGLTYVIAVTVASESPERAAELANALVETYIAGQIEAKVDNAALFRDMLARRLETAGVEMAQEHLDAGDLIAEVREPGLAGLSDAGDIARFQREEEARAARQLYEQLAVRLHAVSAQTDLQLSDSRIVSPALVPADAAFPRSRLILTLAGFTSLALGIGAAFLHENYIGGFTSEQQVEAVLGLPVLATVPRLAGRGDRSDVVDQLVDHPLSAYSEAIRRMRFGLEQLAGAPKSSEDRSSFVVLVSSALPGEGKTTTALSIARAFALAGRDTLLVDGDLRRPSVHSALDLDRQVGLAEYLSEPVTGAFLGRIVSTDEATRLKLLLGARGSRTPTDHLFETERFRSILEVARGQFDVIVLDSPPILSVVDACLLMQQADVLTLVVRWAHTSQTDVRAAVRECLGPARAARRAGIVLAQAGQAEARSGARYRGYYESD